MKHPGSSLPFAFRFVDFDDDAAALQSLSDGPQSGLIGELDALVHTFHRRTLQASQKGRPRPSASSGDVAHALPALPEGAVLERTREGRAFPVRLLVEGALMVGELRQVHADGVVVQTDTLMPIGRTLTLHLSDAVAGVEYTLPLLVVWSMRAGRPTSGLRLNGIPKRIRFSMSDSGALGPALNGFYPGDLTS